MTTIVKPQDLKLKVMEALQEEAYKGIVRIDSQTMRQIGVRPGDVVEIEGGRKTVGIADRAYPSDIGQEIIRMDGILRRNARTGIGEKVSVRKAEVKEAKAVTIAPAQQGVMIQANPDVFQRGLLGRAVLKGDIIALGGARRRRRTFSGSPFEEIFNVFEEGFMGNFGLGGLRFVVADTGGKQAVIITENTEIKVSSKAIEVSEDGKVPDVTYEDVGGLEDEVKKVREMVELPLKHPEIFERLGIEPPKGVLLHGPPGTGKTLLAKAVASETDANFLLINGPEVTSRYYGDSEKRIRDIFEEAEKNAPSIIFIDEIDAIAPKREDTYGEVERRMVAQLLATMDGLKSRGKVVVIGASITGDTPIMIKDENGIKILPIGKFVDQYYKEGEEDIEKNVDDIYTLGFDEHKVNNTFNQTYFSNSAFKKVRSVFRHKVNEIYEIEYVGGKIRTTGNHSVFVRTRQGLKYKPVALLKPGEILVDLPYKVSSHIQKIHEFPMAMNLELPIHDILEIQAGYTRALSGESSSAISLETGKHISTIGRWKRGECIPDELSNAYHNLLPSSVKVTPELMRLLGYYAAEGYTRKEEDKEVDFCFGTHEKEFIKDLIIIMKKVFNVEPSNVRITGSRTNIIYYIKPLSNFFGRLCGKGAYNKHLPSFIFEAPREYFLEFVKGYFRGDGYEFKDGKLQVTSVSEQIIIELNWLLRMHGIKSHLSKTIAKAGRKIGNSIVTKDSIGYRVNIPKTANPFVQNKVLNAKKARIKSIIKLPYDDYVYDLCGCDNEAFFGGKTPLLLHNTNRPNSLDPALRRPGRFDREVSIGVPNKKGRLNILKIHTRNMPLTKDVDLSQLAAITHGFVGADLQALCKEAAMSVLRKVLPDLKAQTDVIPDEVLDKLRVTMEDFKDSLRLVRPSALREVLIEAPNVRWSDVGGLEGLKEELKEAIEWPLKNPQAFKRLGIRPPRGILMYGPPGTGKTMLAKAVATESEANFISVKGPELISMWVGQSEKGIREIFRKARQAAPTIIFFDEIDAIASRRGIDLSSKATERVVNQLLTEMDGLEDLNNVVVIAATNRPDMIDPGLLRPGRFDRIISTSLPDISSREAIFKVHMKNMPLNNVDINRLVDRTEGYAGSDIEALCREAAMIALRMNPNADKVAMEHFEEALDKVKPSVGEKDIKKYKEIEEAYLRKARAPTIRESPSYLG